MRVLCVMVCMDKSVLRVDRDDVGPKLTLCFPYVGVRTKSEEAIVDCE